MAETSTVRGAVAAKEERKANPQHALAKAVEDGNVSAAAIWQAVGIDPKNPTHQAALLVCEKYGLDPLLKHVIVIPQGGVYITRDGYLAAAHNSGNLDGLELVDEGEDDAGWFATVAAWRKGCSRPFSYRGRYPKNAKNKEHGREMAIARAERGALKRAFNIAGDEPTYDQAAEVDVQPEPVAEVVEATLLEAS